MTEHWRCENCGWIGSERVKIVVEDDRLPVCPRCKGVENTLRMLCEEPGCDELISGGSPLAGGGYRFHCHKHRPAALSEKDPIISDKAITWDPRS